MESLATTKLSSKGQVVIPEEIRLRLGLKGRDTVRGRRRSRRRDPQDDRAAGDGGVRRARPHGSRRSTQGGHEAGGREASRCENPAPLGEARPRHERLRRRLDAHAGVVVDDAPQATEKPLLEVPRIRVPATKLQSQRRPGDGHRPAEPKEAPGQPDVDVDLERGLAGLLPPRIILSPAPADFLQRLPARRGPAIKRPWFPLPAHLKHRGSTATRCGPCPAR